jgi:CRISPR/Cas system CSM-associated protein Csm3 (group 7 of RAMP superfamily)
MTRASRITVKEKAIHHTNDSELVQTRVKIDRFTGGAFESALFSEQPLFGNKDTRVELDFTIRPPAPDPRDLQQTPNHVKRSEIGLLLLLLKDLWTGDLPIGGEASVGRGRLRGEKATLHLAEDQTWTFQRKGEYGIEVSGGDRKTLEEFVTEFKQEMEKDDTTR